MSRGNSLKLKDLNTSGLGHSELEQENKLLKQQLADYEQDFKKLQNKHLEMIEYFNMVVQEQRLRIEQQS
jgi:hypothetical protein